MTVKTDDFRLAVRNVARFGDTDVFPYPFENKILAAREDQVVDVLEEMHASFDESVAKYPPLSVRSLTAVGYHGFRASTQIDPIWNAYFLSLVLAIAPDVESARIAPAKATVFSYRFKPDLDSGSLFDRDIGWRSYQETSARRAKDSGVVLRCDIADCYPRIYHHRLENALKLATKDTEVIRRIMKLLTRFADGVSFGLPVGGPAARILCELALNRVDRLLLSESVAFCRFVDDFHIFSSSREDAYAKLVSLSNLLHANEGLSLQRSKTRIMTSAEFIASSDFANATDDESTKPEHEARRFVRLRLRYDPYSPTADQDYDTLYSELSKFDVVGMLTRETRKTRIDVGVTRQLVKAIRYLDAKYQDSAILSLVDNFQVLYPVFPSVMILIKSLLSELQAETRAAVFRAVRTLIETHSYITQVPANLCYALRVLGHDDTSEETDAILSALYKQPVDMMTKRDIIVIMTKRKADYWISDCRRRYSVLTGWERRALIVGSYILADEGAHWRNSIKDEMSSVDRLTMEWAADLKNINALDPAL